jgi:hypothetical protein
MAINVPLRKQPADAAEKKAQAFIDGAGKGLAPTPQVAEPDKPKMVVNMKLDVVLVRRIDAAAKRMGVSRTAWMSMAAGEKLEASGK